MSVTHTLEADVLRRQDPQLADILLGELERQSTTLQLIAAENFTSPAVLAALGSPLANKYAEGYPGARYHGGCEMVDVAERLAVERAKALFGAEHANVQSHSGSSAVLAAYAALLRPGDTVLALGLPYGGHLTHGSPANFSGRWFDFVGYGVDAETGLIDHDQVRTLARNHRPKAVVCGSIAYPRHIDYAVFRDIADEVGAYLIADAAHPMGLVAGGAAPNPVPYADVVCATTHKVLRGPRGGMILCGSDLAERIDRAVFPFTQGGAQMHTIAAKAVAFGEAATPAFAVYAHHHGRHRHTPHHRRPGTPRRRRPGRTGTARGGRDGAGLLRPAARRRPRPAPRHGGRDHPGHGGGGDGAARRTAGERAARRDRNSEGA
jgi:glycine hydroxymethyltransferase